MTFTAKKLLETLWKKIAARPWWFLLILIVDFAAIGALVPIHFNILPKAAQAQITISEMLAERTETISSPEEAATLQKQLIDDPVFFAAYTDVVKWALIFMGLLGLTFVVSRTVLWLLTHAALAAKPRKLPWPRLVLRLVLLTVFWTILGLFFLGVYMNIMQNAYFALEPVVKPFFAHVIGIIGALALSYFAIISYSIAHEPKPFARAFVLGARNVKQLVPVLLAGTVLLVILALDAVWLSKINTWLLFLAVALFGAGIVIARTAMAIAVSLTPDKK